MTVDERVKQAALEFAQAHPIQWDDFLEKWLAAHPEPTVVSEPTSNVYEALPKTPYPPVSDVAVDTVRIHEAKPRKVSKTSEATQQ